MEGLGETFKCNGKRAFYLKDHVDELKQIAPVCVCMSENSQQPEGEFGPLIIWEMEY